jgi:formylglycine-generating enzyme required for sulfatase activity
MLELIAVGEDLAEVSSDEARNNPQRAVQKLREGLPYFLAVAARPAGMTFVPAGTVEAPSPNGAVTTVDVGAFFIDREPVSVGDFAQFSREAHWRTAPARIANQDALVSAVTFYDAQAFAANHEPRRALPAIAQWLRAAHYLQESGAVVPWGEPLDDDAPAEPFRVANGMREWTRTPQSAGVPDFRAALLVASGDCTGEGGCTFAWNAVQFESQRNDVGFRCVYELPDDLASLERLFAR